MKSDRCTSSQLSPPKPYWSSLGCLLRRIRLFDEPFLSAQGQQRGMGRQRDALNAHHRSRCHQAKGTVLSLIASQIRLPWKQLDCHMVLPCRDSPQATLELEEILTTKNQF